MKTIKQIDDEIQRLREMQLKNSLYDKIRLEYAEDLMMHYTRENARAAALEIRIESLMDECARLREALQPFADKWERVRIPYENGATWTGDFPYAPHKAAYEALKGDIE